ncbi:hypothetical protein CBL_10945 [Carabus blaptoides fortunei]
MNRAEETTNGSKLNTWFISVGTRCSCHSDQSLQRFTAAKILQLRYIGGQEACLKLKTTKEQHDDKCHSSDKQQARGEIITRFYLQCIYQGDKCAGLGWPRLAQPMSVRHALDASEQV